MYIVHVQSNWIIMNPGGASSESWIFRQNYDMLPIVVAVMTPWFELHISVFESAVKEDIENFIGDHRHIYLSLLEVNIFS